jgi:hypothetical protein
MGDDSPLSTPVHSETEYSDSDTASRRGPQPDSEPSGEDLADTAHRDYRAIPTLDTYEGAGLDNAEYAAQTAEERLNADLEIRRRRHQAQGVLDFEWDSDEELTILSRREPRQRGDRHLQDLQELLRVDADNPITLQEQPRVISEYLERPEVRREVIRRFHDFLVNFKDETGEAVYLSRIRTMGARNQMSF